MDNYAERSCHLAYKEALECAVMDFVLVFCWQVYREAQDSTVGCAVYCSPFNSSPDLLHGMPLSTQYKALDSVDIKRLAARRQNTTYCYDFPLVCSALQCQLPIHPCPQRR